MLSQLGAEAELITGAVGKFLPRLVEWFVRGWLIVPLRLTIR